MALLYTRFSFSKTFGLVFKAGESISKGHRFMISPWSKLSPTAACSVSRPLPSPSLSASPLDVPTLASPIHPTPRILAHLGPARLPCQSRRRPTPHAGLAVKYNLLVLLWARVAEPILKLLLCDMEAVGGCSDGNVDRVRDMAGGSEFAWFTDVCEE